MGFVLKIAASAAWLAYRKLDLREILASGARSKRRRTNGLE
jgi:hypothetical protein